MGKIVTPTYRVEWQGNDGHHVWAWRGRLPKNNEALRYFAQVTVDSYKPGGCNAHVSTVLGFMPAPSTIQIVNQKTDTIVRHWKAPMFMVW